MTDTNAATSTELLQELRAAGPVFIMAHSANTIAYVRAHKGSLADAVRSYEPTARFSVTRVLYPSDSVGLYVTLPGETR